MQLDTRASSGKLRLAIVGAGGFLRAAHLPILRALADRFSVQAVMSRTGHTAKEVAQSAGAAYATTDLDKVLSDPEVDAVLIATRHDLHARLALQALRAGKHVLVEKPLALHAAELKPIEEFFSGQASAPVLLTGFNRRFSRHARALREQVAGRTAMLAYRMNAGRLPPEHWIYGSEGGGRNLGEACHVYDLFTYLIGGRVHSVQAASISPRDGYYRTDDNFSALITFEDGSLASLLYTAMGDPGAAKEQLDAYFGGKLAHLDDYRRLECSGSAAIEGGTPAKGLREELEAFHAAATGRTPWPMLLWEQLQACRIAFEVERALAGAKAS